MGHRVSGLKGRHSALAGKSNKPGGKAGRPQTLLADVAPPDGEEAANPCSPHHRGPATHTKKKKKKRLWTQSRPELSAILVLGKSQVKGQGAPFLANHGGKKRETPPAQNHVRSWKGSKSWL